MRILILSDLHLEFGTFVPNASGYDVVILAGDIAVPAEKAIRWALRESTFRAAKAIVFVPGNHEFYGHTVQPVLRDMKAAASLDTRLHALDCDQVVIDGVRFLGCTLWSDFAVRVEMEHGLASLPERAMEICAGAVNDFRAIKIEVDDAGPAGKRGRRTFWPEDALRIHHEHRAWLAQCLAEPFAGPTVVVTHHAPHRKSLHAMYNDSWTSGAFVSELPETFFEVPVLWVHGHTHTSADYKVGRCRVVSNPRGYPLFNGKDENDQFNPRLIVEVGNASQ